MKNTTKILMIGLIMLLVSIACSAGGIEDLLQEAINAAVELASEEYGIDLPTDKVKQVSVENGTIILIVEGNFETLVAVMQSNALDGGMVENELTTVVTDDVASMVYTNPETNISVVIQLVDLGDGTVSIALSPGS